MLGYKQKWTAPLALFLMLGASVAQAQGILYLSVDEGEDELYTVNTSTAAVTKIGLPGSQDSSTEGLAPGPTGSVFLFGVNNSDDLSKINRDGSGYSEVDIEPDDCDRGLAYNTTTGKLYGSDNEIFCEINPADGSTTLLPVPPNNGEDGDLEGLAADPDNNFIYGINTDEDLVRFDVGANSWSTIGATAGISNASDIGVAYDPSTRTIYAVDSSGILYSVDPDDGTSIEIGDTGLGSGLDVGLAFVMNAVSSPRATFEVTKDFTDDNPAEVEVMLSCNTGLILDQSKSISEATGVVFVVTEFDNGELNCEISENVPAGYEAGYDDGTVTNEISCKYEGINHDSAFSCVITNTPAAVDIVIEKEWVFEGSSGPDSIDTGYRLTLWCDAEIVGGFGGNGNGDSPAIVILPGCGVPSISSHDWCKTFFNDGSALFNAQVIPAYPDSHCYVTEMPYDDAVEIDNGCQSLTVSAGMGASCKITNTVFFEGIPTLGQYGMAMLALLMLGVGFVGFRRWA